MKALVLEKDKKTLEYKDLPIPIPRDGEILIKVLACGVCRTDVHIVDRELPDLEYPKILGHQIVGIVQNDGKHFQKGDRVGVPWLGYACGKCDFCHAHKENLCNFPEFTGYTKNGGFAEYTTACEEFAIHLPESELPENQAPLLCAGLIGYRSYKKALPAESIGFYGFGSSAHIILQLAVSLGKKIFVFTKPNDIEGQKFAFSLGAVWAGSSVVLPEEKLDAAILFAPAGNLIPQALKAVKKGGKVVCAGIHMSDIPSFPYEFLWEERSIHSVANLTREDAKQFFELEKQFPIKVKVNIYSLEEGNKAIQDIRAGKIEGSAVIRI